MYYINRIPKTKVALMEMVKELRTSGLFEMKHLKDKDGDMTLHLRPKFEKMSR